MQAVAPIPPVRLTCHSMPCRQRQARWARAGGHRPAHCVGMGCQHRRTAGHRLYQQGAHQRLGGGRASTRGSRRQCARLGGSPVGGCGLSRCCCHGAPRVGFLWRGALCAAVSQRPGVGRRQQCSRSLRPAHRAACSGRVERGPTAGKRRAGSGSQLRRAQHGGCHACREAAGVRLQRVRAGCDGPPGWLLLPAG